MAVHSELNVITFASEFGHQGPEVPITTHESGSRRPLGRTILVIEASESLQLLWVGNMFFTIIAVHRVSMFECTVLVFAVFLMPWHAFYHEGYGNQT
jgi:hypothetical protein